MNISYVERKENYARIAVTLEQNDYAEKVASEVKKLSKKVSVPGFRKGHVPVAMIQKMYGDSVRIDVIQEMISTELHKFIENEKLEGIGQPFLPKELGQEEALNNTGDITLTFDLPLVPSIKGVFTKRDKFDYLKATATLEDAKEELHRIQEGSYKRVETDDIVEKSIVYGTLAELEGDTPKENGVRVEDMAILYVQAIVDEDEKKKFLASSKNSVVVFNPYKAFAGRMSELKSLFNRHDISDVEPFKETDFSFEIKKVISHVAPELDQEFFDQLFGEGVVSSDDAALEKIKESLTERNKQNADALLAREVRNRVLEKKIGQLELAEEAIKEGFQEKVEAVKDDAQFAEMIKSLKEDLIFSHIAKELEVKVSREEVVEYAKAQVISQFMSFGWNNAPEEIIQKQVETLLGDQNQVYNINQNILIGKVVAALHEKEIFTVNEKEVTTKELMNQISEVEKK